MAHHTKAPWTPSTTGREQQLENNYLKCTLHFISYFPCMQLYKFPPSQGRVGEASAGSTAAGLAGRLQDAHISFKHISALMSNRTPSARVA